MEFVILGLLFYQNMTIYELNNSFKQGLSLIYSASYGSLQTGVKKLLSADKIACHERVENGRNKKIYSLTDKGRNAFHEWMSEPLPEKKMETFMLAKCFFLGLIENKDHRCELIKSMLNQVKAITVTLEQYRSDIHDIELPDAYKIHAAYQFKTLDYGVVAHKAAVTWLEDLLKATQDECL